MKRNASIPSGYIYYGTEAKRPAPARWDADKTHGVRITKIRPPQECSTQELITKLVRRALQSPDIKAVQKEIARSRLQVNTING